MRVPLFASLAKISVSSINFSVDFIGKNTNVTGGYSTGHLLREFWASLSPVSRMAYPKQFVPILDGKSLLQLTLERVSLTGHLRLWAIGVEDLASCRALAV
jgi:hypothetical protein